MATKWKKYSYASFTKIIAFILMIACFTGVVLSLVNIVTTPFRSVIQESYFESGKYLTESQYLINDLTKLMGEYKNEEHILAGESISENEWQEVESELYDDFKENSSKYSPERDEEENYALFLEEYANQITQAKDELIQKELKEYNTLVQNIKNVEVPLFYATDGTKVYTNTSITERKQFESYPAYFIFENYEQKFYPKETYDNPFLHWITDEVEKLDPENTVIYLAFTKEFLQTKIQEWEEASDLAATSLYQLTLYMVGFVFSFIYLAIVIGRKHPDDQQVHFYAWDRIYTDVNMLLCGFLILFFIALLDFTFEINKATLPPIIATIATLGFALIFSLIKHMKNRTFITHSLLYTIFIKVKNFVGEVYAQGNSAVKTMLLVIGYPLLVGLTWFMFPVTIGISAWYTLKKIQAFTAIRDGVAKIKAGDLQHHIEVDVKGELATLAGNINSITDGLKNAVQNELRSERLKTELITNVSHDIRTPLTSIITYVDLLKHEKDPAKTKEYIDVLDQKARRLKQLTDNLFEAAKASSGDIPVHLETIDLIALVNQGLGEFDDKIRERNLQLKLTVPEDKLYVHADGRLLWRAIENVLSNICKYALVGSRVYIDMEDSGNSVQLTFKNISADELNISADELMERFKRGDESRSTEGSGLGLSIAQSLIEIQKGKFYIEIDGDLFKSVFVLPKYQNDSLD